MPAVIRLVFADLKLIQIFMVRAPQKRTKKQELREDTVVTLYARALAFFEMHRRTVLLAVGSVLLLFILGMAYSYYQQQREEKAQELLGPAVRLYEMGNYQSALEGTPEQPGLLEIIEEYGDTHAGNLARFYAGEAYYKLGDKEKALEYFESFEEEPNLLGAASYATAGAIYEDLGEYEKAAERYRQAALIYPNPAIAPEYLARAARNYEKTGQFDKAKEMYLLIQEKYPESGYAQAIDLYLSRLESLQKSHQTS